MNCYHSTIGKTYLFFIKGYAYNAQKYHFATYNTLEQKFK